MQTRDLHGHTKESLDDNIQVPKILNLFKNICTFGIFETNLHLLILNGHRSHVFYCRGNTTSTTTWFKHHHISFP
jgi:hypothetical protein